MVATCSSVMKTISSETTDKTWSQASNSVREARTASCVDVRWRWGTGCSELNDGHRPRAHFGVVQWQSKSSNTRSERSRLTATGAWQRQGYLWQQGQRIAYGQARNAMFGYEMRAQALGTTLGLQSVIERAWTRQHAIVWETARNACGRNASASASMRGNQRSEAWGTQWLQCASVLDAAQRHRECCCGGGTV